MLFRDVQHADLGGENQPMVIRQIIPGRAKPVSVQNCSDEYTIGKQNRRWPIPGFHHCGIIAVHVSPFAGDRFVVLPWLRDCHHHCQRKVDSVHYQKFDRIVQHGGIGTG